MGSFLPLSPSMAMTGPGSKDKGPGCGVHQHPYSQLTR